MKILFIIVVLLVVLIVGGLFYLGHQSSSGTAPGLTDGRLATCPPSPNCVSSEIGTPEDQKVQPLPVDIWPDIPAAVQELGGTITQQGGSYVSAEFVSSIFKFTDDVEFRLGEDAVHVRSASRVGHSDMGANSARVRAIRERLSTD